MKFNTKVKEELLTKQNILKYISPYDVFNYFIPDLDIGGIMHSPFREDNNPSFGIFVGYSGELVFNDYRLGGGDCIKFVMLKENVDYKTALSIINKIFNLELLDLSSGSNYVVTKKVTKTNYKPVKKQKPLISIKVRKWNDYDLEYWNPINPKIFKEVFPIQFFWLNDLMFNAHKYSYAYRYSKNIYKIYQPMLTVDNGKWWSNISNEVDWFGHRYLPDKDDVLFVTSSNKDAMVLNTLNYNAIAPHTESQIFSARQYEEYSKRFKRIIIFYDNDKTGLERANLFSTTYNLDYIVLEEEDTKDPFEFVKKYDLETLEDWIEQWI